MLERLLGTQFKPDQKFEAHDIHLSYRPHIDGLRAIAVLGVVISHINLIPNRLVPIDMPGGFVGVDVFFVISGFLISKIIFVGCLDGTFSFLNFYARRARRILPAFLFVSLLTLVAGFYILLPLEYEHLAESFIAALLFSANIYFFATANYFGPGSAELPMLHYWSLGVEEQFYLVFPLFVFLTIRLGKRLFGAMLVLILVASIGAAEVVIRINPTAAFYLLPYRMFELLVGSLLALPHFYKASNLYIARIAGAGGLILIVGSFFIIDNSIRFPGLSVLPVCIGAALIIWSGEHTITFPVNLLATSPLVRVGKWSYSLYLVHWPLNLFAVRLYPFSEYRSLVVLLTSIGLSWLIYTFIENPARRSRVLNNAKNTFAAASVAVISGLGISLFIAAEGGLSWRVEDHVNRLAAYLSYKNAQQFHSACLLKVTESPEDSADSCLPKSDKPMIVIWGDSAIAQYASTFEKQFSSRGFSLGQLTADACPPAIHLNFVGRPNCMGFNDWALRKIISLRPAYVIIGSAWPGEMDVYDHTEESISELQKAGLRVVVMGLGPGYTKPVPTILAERYKNGNPSVTSDDDLYKDWILRTDKWFRARVEGHPPAKYISIIATVCPKNLCPLLVGGIPTHFDHFHVTEEGASLYASQFVDQIFN